MKTSFVLGNSLPLTELRVVGHIADGVCRAAFKGTFENKLDHPIEISFTFPLPADFCSTEFKVSYNGKKSVSEVAKTEEAKIEYDDTLAQSDFAAIAQVNNENEIRIDIGALSPKEKCKFSLYFVCALSPFNDGYVLTMPTSILSGNNEVQVGYTPPPMRISFDVTDSTNEIKSITTPFMNNTVIDIEKGTVRCDNVAVFNQLQIVIRFKERCLGRCIYQFHDGNTFVHMTGTSPGVLRDHNSQFTLMFMNGSFLNDGQLSLLMRAFEYFILSVPFGSKLNICSYGAFTDKLFDYPLTLNNENRKKAFLYSKRQGYPSQKSEDFVDFHQKIIDDIENNNTDNLESVIVIIAPTIPKGASLSDKHKYFLLDPFSRGDMRKIAADLNAYYVSVADESSLVASLLSIIKMTSTTTLDHAQIKIGSIDLQVDNIFPYSTFSKFLMLEGEISEDDLQKAHITFDNVDLPISSKKSILPIIHNIWAYQVIKTASSETEKEFEIANKILMPSESPVAIIEREDEVDGDVSHIDSRISRVGIGWVSEEKEDETETKVNPIPRPIPHPMPRPIPRPFPRPMPRPLHRPPHIFIRRKANSSESAKIGTYYNFLDDPSNTSKTNNSTANNSSTKRNEQPNHMNNETQKAQTKNLPFFLLRVLQLQNEDGSWTNEKFLANSCGFPIPSDSKGLTREQFVTAFIIACIKKKAPNDEEKYELIIEKGFTFLMRSNSDIDWSDMVDSIYHDLQ